MQLNNNNNLQTMLKLWCGCGCEKISYCIFMIRSLQIVCVAPGYRPPETIIKSKIISDGERAHGFRCTLLLNARGMSVYCIWDSGEREF